MAIQYNIPYQNLTFQLPENAQVFRGLGDIGQSIYLRQGNKLSVINLENLPGVQLTQAEKTAAGNWGGQVGLIKERLKSKYNIDWNALPTYNLGDLMSSGQYQTYQKAGPSGGPDNPFHPLSDISQFMKPQPQPSGEVITSTIDPTNPHRAIDVSSLSGQTPTPPPANYMQNLLGGQYNVQGTPTAPTPTAPVDKYEFSRQMAAMPAPTPTISQQDYQKRANETIDQYTARIAALRGETPTTPAPDDTSQTPDQQMYISTGDPKYDALLKANQDLLESLAKQGQYLNPNIQLTQEQLTEFMSKAQAEIDPYFKTQLGLAKETLLKSMGYTTEGIQQYEAAAERKYGQNVRTLGEGMAEKGFALSGMRGRGEQDLAYETQQDIEANRRQLGYQAGTQAREFAQQWGGVPGYEQPSTTIPQAPRVLSGEMGFQRSGEQTPFYELSSGVYSGLIGEKQKERLTGTRTLADYYGGLARQGMNIETIRKLTI